MKKFLIDNNSDTLLIFFTGWGCDEFEFEHLKSNSDILLLYDYSELNLDFDFFKYKKYNLIAFSAGVFVASIYNFDFEINKKVAIDGNPYLFDEQFGLSNEIQNILYNITEENAYSFARNYLVKTNEEYQNFHPSKRTLESCRIEFDNLRKLYETHKKQIKNIYDYAIFGKEDPIFNVKYQKEFYKDKLHLIKNSRHNPFFRIQNYEQILNFDKQLML